MKKAVPFLITLLLFLSVSLAGLIPCPRHTGAIGVKLVDIFDVAAATANEPLFRDDFIGDLSSWTAPSGIWNIIEGRLDGETTIEGLIYAGDLSWTDYILDTKVRILSDSGIEEAAFIVRLTDSDDFYWLGLGCWGHRVSISKRAEGIPQELVYSGSRSEVQVDTWYDIRIVCSSGFLQLYVDGVLELAYKDTDSPHLNGAIGVKHYNSHIQVEYVEVAYKADWWSQPVNLMPGNGVWDSSPEISGDGSRIAFLSWLDDNLDLWVMDSDGDNPEKLIDNDAYEYTPSISDDGSKIAYQSSLPGVSYYEIFVVEPGTQDPPRRLTDNMLDDKAPIISGDGSKVAFLSVPKYDTLYIADSGGSTPPERLTTPNKNEGAPSISDDGSIITFHYTPDYELDHEIYVFDTEKRRLTFNDAQDTGPIISGDGSKIVYTSDDGGDREIFLIDLNTLETLQLTNNTADDGSPVISDDGSKIAFVSGDAYDSSTREIFVINSDGTGLQQLTDNSCSDINPSINDDGTMIVFQSDLDGDYDIYLLQRDVNAPETIVESYDPDHWYTTDFTINLIGTDDLSGVAGTYYKINDDPTVHNAKDSQPQIREESANIVLEYWSEDEAGHIESLNTLEGIKLDKTPPTGSITIAGGADYTLSSSVTLDLSSYDETSQVAYMHFSHTGDAWSEWEDFSSSSTWELIPGDYEKTVYVQFKDNAGHISQSYSDTIVLDTTPPTGSVVIAEGAEKTAIISVELTLDATDETSEVADMCFSNDQTSWSSWEPYAPSKTWSLLTGDGEKTVYAKFRDHAGIESDIVWDTITLDTVTDTEPPTGSVVIAGGSDYTDSLSVTLTLSAYDETSEVADMHFSNDGTDWTEWEPYSTSKDWTLTTGDGEKTVHVEFKDNAGHISQSYSDTIVLDTTPPTGSVVIAGGSDYTDSLSVTLTLSAYDETSEVADMCFSNDQTSWSSWEPYAPSKTWSLLTGDGEKTVYAKFRDHAGKESDVYSSSIILDELPPSIALTVSLTNGTEIKSSTYELSWVAQDDGSDMDHYEVRLDNGTWTSIGTLTTYTFTGLGDGGHTLEVKAVDKVNHSQIYSVYVVANTSLIGGPGYLEEALLGVAIAAIPVGLAIYKIKKRPKPPPKPKRVKIHAEPRKIVADGKSTSTITIELLDKEGNPIVAAADTEVKLIPTGGKVESRVVKIPKGKEKAETVLISSTKSGTISLSADARGLESIAITLEFKEKARFCMGCGSRLAAKDIACRECGASPADFGGPETRTCHCGAVIPATARFCSECGAKQTPTEQ